MSDGRILIADDEPSVRDSVGYALEQEGFEVTLAVDGEDVEEKIGGSEMPFDLLVLDIMMPGRSGLDICRDVRSRSPVPIILLTAKDAEVDKVVGLEVGADDYLAKPYRLRELLARVRALSRRRGAAGESGASLPGFELDRQARTVTPNGGVTLELTRTEFDLLLFFVNHEGKALSRDVILQRVWGEDVVVDPRTVDNFVSSLKRKLEWTSDTGFAFRSVRGVGYRFERVER